MIAQDSRVDEEPQNGYSFPLRTSYGQPTPAAGCDGYFGHPFRK